MSVFCTRTQRLRRTGETLNKSKSPPETNGIIPHCLQNPFPAQNTEYSSANCPVFGWILDSGLYSGLNGRLRYKRETAEQASADWMAPKVNGVPRDHRDACNFSIIPKKGAVLCY
jgi:hypothetical protein